MTDNKVVIEGEAPETDSDDDTKIGNKVSMHAGIYKHEYNCDVLVG